MHGCACVCACAWVCMCICVVHECVYVYVHGCVCLYGRCAMGQTFKRTFGLRAFPSLVLFPSGMASSAYFRIPFEDDNTTAHTLIDTVLDYVHRTETQLPFLSSFSTNVHAAISQLVSGQ